MDLNLIIVMAALLRERSVTRAAKTLGRSQSAISHALNRLRLLLGDPLFVRCPGGVSPSPAALTLEPAINAILENADSFFGNKRRFDPKRHKRVFHVGLSDYTSFLSLPGIVAELDRYSGVEMMVKNTSHSLGYGMLESGEVELIVGNFPPAPSFIRERVLFLEEYVCAMRKSHPAAGRKLTLDLYRNSKHLVVSLQGSRSGGYLDSAILKLGLARKVQVVTGHFVPVPFILLENDAIATEPSRMIMPLAKVLGLAVRKPPFKIDPMPIKMAWHRRLDNDAGHEWLRGLFAKHVK